MIGQSSIKDKLRVDVAISSEMSAALQEWSDMYANQASWLTTEIKSLGLPAAIASEIARAVTIEMEVEITGSARADWLALQFDRVKPKLRQMLEYGLAKGGLVFKPYVNGDQIAVDYVQADQFYPVAFDANGNMTSCVFADQRQMGANYYTRLEFHQFAGTACQIRNMAFKSSAKDTLGSEIPLAEFDAWKDLQPDATISNIDRPLFAYYRVPVANNIDPTSPLGVSCYSRATELIRQADEQWSRLIWEMESGNRAIYIDELAFEQGTDGLPKLPDKRLYRTIQMSGDIGEEDLFHDWSPEFRDEAQKRAFNAILQRIEFNCGLSYGVISDPLMVEKTATEIAASKQRLQATIVDNQRALEVADNNLIYAMDIYATLYSLAPAGAYETGHDFDDSLIVDSEAQFSQDLRTVGIAAMPLDEFLMRNYGLTEKTALEWLKRKQAEQPADFFQDGQGA